jgi:hypothetical protein
MSKTVFCGNQTKNNMHRSLEDFEQKLKEFFDRHDPAKRGLSHTIAKHFVNHQDEVFEHLSELYHEKEGIHVTDDAIFNTSFGPSTGAEPF